ncbi:hypothetical protein HW555_012981, partial [Spodoptera exigua]
MLDHLDIEMNEEVKAFESPRHLVHADKAFAALTMCVLKQRDALQGTLQELLQWARNSVSLSYDTLLQKVSDLFSTGDYSRCSSDLLQIICGHRAEILQMRRDCVTKQAKDPLMKASLKKIPPTCTNLFNAEKFTAAIEKSGGVRKCFWPLQKGNTSSASQADPNKFRGPSQGSKPYNKSLQGFSRNAQACQHITTHSQCVGSDPPSQGGCSHSNPPPQGDSNPRGHAAQYNSVAPNNRSNFRGRPNARQNNQSKHVRKRALSPQRNNDNKRRAHDTQGAPKPRGSTQFCELHCSERKTQFSSASELIERNFEVESQDIAQLTSGVLENLIWWRQNCEQSSAIHMPPPMHFLTTDASDIAWGARLDNLSLSALQKSVPHGKPPIWNINDLANFLDSKRIDENNIFQVQRHTAALLLLCSGRRIHDLTLLRVDSNNYSNQDDV